MDEQELHRRAGQLFERTMDLVPAERERVLAQAETEPDGPRVVARVRALLASDDGDGSSESPPEPDALLGSALRDYAIVELIDAGGMGAVYRGRRQSPPEDVAIKVLSVWPVGAEAQERFQTEVELLASFDHPGIVGYRDSGQTQDGRLFLVMDLINGGPLSSRHPVVRSSVEKTVGLALRAAAAVQYMHARPALHRDLKPSNILVHDGAEGPQPVLIDLGIARRLDEPPGGGLTLGRVLGTPAFMSPEQAHGGEIAVTTDVYGLGAVLYELLTGHPPRGLDQVAPGDIDEERRRLAGPARPPSECVDPNVFGAADAQRRARRMRGDLDAIVLKAIETDPKDRYGSVEALRADLFRWIGHEPIVARRIGSAGRTWRLARRYPKQTVLAVATALLLSITSLVTWRSLVRERRAQIGLEQQLETTRAIRDFMTHDVFHPASPELEGPDTPVGEIVRNAVERIGPALDDQPPVAVGLRSALLSVLSSMGDLEGAREQAALARPLAEELAPDHPQRLEFDVESGLLAQQEGRYEEAAAELRDVVARIRSTPQAPEDLLPKALGGLGLALYELNRLEESLAVHEEALELLPPGSQGRWTVLPNAVLVLEELRGPAAALPLQEEFLDTLRARFSPQHVYVMAQANNLASTYLDLDRPQEALPRAREAMALANTHFGPDDLTRLTVLNTLAACLSKTGEFDQALPMRREVLEARLRILGEDNPAVAVAAMNLASTLTSAGQPAQAMEPARLAVRCVEANGDPDHPRRAQAYRALATALEGAGSVEEALEAYDKALAIFSKAKGDHTADIAKLRAKREALAGG
jgi:eukaryotic-like serine/threonine-protein kinase